MSNARRMSVSTTLLNPRTKMVIVPTPGGPNLADVWQHLSFPGQVRAKSRLGNNRDNVYRADIGRLRADAGRFRAKCGRPKCNRFRTKLADVGRNRPKFGHTWPAFGRSLPASAPCRPDSIRPNVDESTSPQGVADKALSLRVAQRAHGALGG